jgi:hypothetical protein
MLLTMFVVSDRAGLVGLGDRGGCRRCCRLPVGGQQDGELVLVGHGWQAFEQVGEPGFGIVAVTLGAFDHGVDDGGPLSGGFSAEEEPVLFSNCRGTDGILAEVVVDLSVLEEKGQAVPEGVRVVDGAAEPALGQNLGALALGEQLR